MNLTTDSAKLQSLVSHTLMGTAKPLQPKSTVIFNEESVHLGAMFMSAVSVYGNFKKSYFGNGKSYKADSIEYLVFTNSLLKRLIDSFTQKEITFGTDKEKLFVVSQDGKTEYEEPLMKPEETVTADKFPIPMAATEWGFLPKTNKQLPVKLFLKSSDIRFPIGAEHVIFEYAKGKLKSKIESVGKLRQEVDVISQSPESEGQTVTSKVSGFYLAPVLSALEGNIWMIMHPEVLVLSETDDHHSITYLIATRKN